MALDLQSQINVFWYAQQNTEWLCANEYAGETPIQILLIQRAIQLMCGQMVLFRMITIPEMSKADRY